jgi:hypothetical protein
MGSQEPEFAAPMIEELERRLRKDEHKPDEIAWEPIHWAPLIEERERKLWRNLSKENDLDWVRLRKFIIHAFGDAIAYQRVRSPHNTMYERVQKHIHGSFLRLRSALGGADKPLIVIGHSLGCVMITDYIWDRQHASEAGSSGRTRFERAETLTGLVTFGCNIPLFTLGYDQPKIIAFPPPELPAKLKTVARWNNYYDPDDALGYPLKPINRSFQRAVTEDIAINVGSPLTMWNALSHTAYWTDNDFTVPVARYIGEVLSVL